MNKTLFICILSWTFAWAALAAQRVKTDIDWPSFLGRQDMVWNVLPEQWYESAYMGNGELGLMMYKEPGKNWLRLEVSNCRLHDHRSGTGLLANPRLLSGHFRLRPVGTIEGGTLRTDLWNAEITGQVRTSKGTPARAHPPCRPPWARGTTHWPISTNCLLPFSRSIPSIASRDRSSRLPCRRRSPSTTCSSRAGAENSVCFLSCPMPGRMWPTRIGGRKVPFW